MQHYLFLSSRDAAHPGSSSGDFTIELPKRYDLKGHWECALLEISFKSSYRQRLNVCCDLIEDSCIQKTLFPVLRVISTHEAVNGNSDYVHRTFERPYFFQIRKKELDRVRIFIRGSDFQPLVLESPVQCVLLLRKKQKVWDP